GFRATPGARPGRSLGSRPRGRRDARDRRRPRAPVERPLPATRTSAPAPRHARAPPGAVLRTPDRRGALAAGLLLPATRPAGGPCRSAWTHTETVRSPGAAAPGASGVQT